MTTAAGKLMQSTAVEQRETIIVNNQKPQADTIKHL